MLSWITLGISLLALAISGWVWWDSHRGFIIEWDLDDE